MKFYSYDYVLSQTSQSNGFSSASRSSGSVWNETANSSSNRQMKKIRNPPYYKMVLSRLIFLILLARQKNGWWRDWLKTAILIFLMSSSLSMKVAI